MCGVCLHERRLSVRKDLPVPCPEANEALVRARLAGICGTDLALLAGYLPYDGIPGHEWVGEVVACEADEWVGRRVVGEINLGCGECRYCQAGIPTHCERRTVIGIRQRAGAFAEYLTVPIANLHTVAESISDEAAVFTEPLAAALSIQTACPIGPEHRVLLIGAGRLGQLIAQTLALTGCELAVIARYPAQRACLEGRGIACLDEGAIESAGYDRVIEATGSPGGLELALKAVRPRGTVVLKSTYPGRPSIDTARLVVDEITLVGSRCGPFAPALNLLEQQAVDPTPLIEARYPLDRAVEAFERARQSGASKVLLHVA